MDLDLVELHQDRARIDLARSVSGDRGEIGRAARESDVVAGWELCDRPGRIARPGRLRRDAELLR
jgi:hypothetical protein